MIWMIITFFALDAVAFAAPEEHGLSQQAVEIARPFGFPITNSMVLTWIVAVGLILFAQIGPIGFVKELFAPKGESAGALRLRTTSSPYRRSDPSWPASARLRRRRVDGRGQDDQRSRCDLIGLGRAGRSCLPLADVAGWLA